MKMLVGNSGMRTVERSNDRTGGPGLTKRRGRAKAAINIVTFIWSKIDKYITATRVTI